MKRPIAVLLIIITLGLIVGQGNYLRATGNIIVQMGNTSLDSRSWRVSTNVDTATAQSLNAVFGLNFAGTTVLNPVSMNLLHRQTYEITYTVPFTVNQTGEFYLHHTFQNTAHDHTGPLLSSTLTYSITIRDQSLMHRTVSYEAGRTNSDTWSNTITLTAGRTYYMIFRSQVSVNMIVRNRLQFNWRLSAAREEIEQQEYYFIPWRQSRTHKYYLFSSLQEPIEYVRRASGTFVVRDDNNESFRPQLYRVNHYPAQTRWQFGAQFESSAQMDLIDLRIPQRIGSSITVLTLENDFNANYMTVNNNELNNRFIIGYPGNSFSALLISHTMERPSALYNLIFYIRTPSVDFPLQLPNFTVIINMQQINVQNIVQINDNREITFVTPSGETRTTNNWFFNQQYQFFNIRYGDRNYTLTINDNSVTYVIHDNSTGNTYITNIFHGEPNDPTDPDTCGCIGDCCPCCSCHGEPSQDWCCMLNARTIMRRMCQTPECETLPEDYHASTCPAYIQDNRRWCYDCHEPDTEFNGCRMPCIGYFQNHTPEYRHIINEICAKRDCCSCCSCPIPPDEPEEPPDWWEWLQTILLLILAELRVQTNILDSMEYLLEQILQAILAMNRDDECCGDEQITDERERPDDDRTFVERIWDFFLDLLFAILEFILELFRMILELIVQILRLLLGIIMQAISWVTDNVVGFFALFTEESPINQWHRKGDELWTE